MFMRSLTSILFIIICFSSMGCNRVEKVDYHNGEEGIYKEEYNKNEEMNHILKSEKAKIYAEVFDIVCEFDTSLNTNIKYINVDTSSLIDLTDSEKEELKTYIGEKYKLIILDKTFDELEEEGYIENMGFKEGIMFKANEYLVNTDNEISFEAMKWVGGCGAIGFTVTATKYNNRWILNKCENTWIS